MSEPYSVGTITVANGSTSVAGTDTFWVGKTRANDMLFVPAQGLMARITADPTDNDVMAITAWAGTSLTDAAYEIIPASDTTTSAARLRDLLAQMSVIEANGRGLFYRFSDSVADADPSSGYIRLNNATIGSATAAYVDNLDANGATVSGEIDTWDDSTSLTKGSLWLRSIADPSAFHAFKVTGSVVDGTGYRKLTLAYVGGSSTFSAEDEMMAFFVPNGDQGDSFAYDAAVADIAGRAAYDDEAAGFVVMVTDDGGDPSRSAFYTMGAGGTADWSLTAYLSGPQGEGATVTVGTVTTVAPEVAAAVTNSGTAGDAVLDFDIPQGIQGERGINWQGDYSGATAYVLDDGVLYNGSSWRALQATTGNAPPTLPTTSNAYWQLLARQGTDGAGAGDMIGPASATANAIVLFDGTGGKQTKDSGVTIIDEDDMASDSADAVPTQQSVKAYIDAEGYPDTNRRNQLLAMCDIAKAMSGYRRGIDTVACGFKASGDADASSTGGAVDVSAGAWKPTPSSTTEGSASTSGAGNTVPLYTLFSREFAVDNGVTIATVGVFSDVAGTGKIKIANEDSTTQFDILTEVSITHGGAGWQDFALAYTTPGSGTLRIGVYWATGGKQSGHASVARSFKSGDVAGSDQSGFTADTNGCYALRYSHSAIATNASLVLPFQTADAARTKARAIIEIDPVDATTLGTDLTIELTCDAGANWHAASTYTDCGKGQSGHTVVETDHVTCTSGTSFSARIKNLNNKTVHVYKASVEVAA